MTAMNQLTIIKKILIESTSIICDHLDPKIVLRAMKTKGALTHNNVELIESEPVKSDQAEVMLNILMRKPASAYDIFMETLLGNGRKDLYDQIRHIETKYGYVRAGMVKSPFQNIVSFFSSNNLQVQFT